MGLSQNVLLTGDESVIDVLVKPQNKLAAIIWKEYQHLKWEYSADKCLVNYRVS